jgi:hypothetical protein
MQAITTKIEFYRMLGACAAALLIAASASAQKIKAFETLDDLERCAQRNSWDTGVCLEPLQQYAKRHPKENFAIAKRARLQFKHWAALQFFEPALGKSPTAAQCADEDLSLAVISGLALPDSYKELATAKSIFGGACFSALRSVVEKEIVGKSGAGYISQNACPTLLAKGVNLGECAQYAKGATPPVAATTSASSEPPPPIPMVDLKSAKFGLAKVYVGPEGERIAIANIEGVQDAFAIRIWGVRSNVNEKTVVHREIAAGTGANYVAMLEGSRWVTVTRRQSYGNDWALYPPGIKDPIRLSYSEKDTKGFDREMFRK